ncbi:MAG TPA: nucleotidyltransferase family protein [Spirochaetota bacterium]|nr:nucleotidyltransferase family protein [Spirochaetota bacterium]
MANKAHAVVLAAGLSSRAGAFKMELVIDGRPLLHHVLASALGAVASIIVVTGHEAGRVNSLVDRFLIQYSPRIPVTLCHNPLYQEGMFTSVLAGLRAVPAGEPALLQPGDSPLVRAETWASLIARAEAGHAPAVLIPVCGGKKGHPVFLPPGVVAAVTSDFGEGRSGTLKEALASHSQEFVEVNDQGVLIDLDTLEDYRRIETLVGRIRR